MVSFCIPYLFLPFTGKNKYSDVLNWDFHETSAGFKCETSRGPKSISKVFQTIFTNMAKTLLQKLPPPPKQIWYWFGKNVCKNLNITTKFQLKPTTENVVLKLLKNIDISKAAGVDNLPGRFLKDGAVILAKPVTEICNLSIKLKIFPDLCKLAKLKPIF